MSSEPSDPPPPLWPLALAALGALLLALAWDYRADLDINDFDDLSRTVLAQFFADRPEYFRSPAYDAYWLPLPHAARGCAISMLRACGPDSASAGRLACHLVSVACLWGAWLALGSTLRLLGARAVGLGAFTIAYLACAGTCRFAASAYSEPDHLLFVALAVRLASGLALAERQAARSLLALAAALALANLTRYEAWTVSAALGAWIGWRRGGRFPPWALAAAIAIILAPALWWLWRAEQAKGAALHFIGQGTSYIGKFPMHDFARRFAKAFAKHNAAAVVLAAPLAALAIRSRWRDAPSQPLALALAVSLAWTLFKLGKIQLITRFTWDTLILLFAVAALGVEVLLKRLPAPRRAAALAASAAAILAAFLAQMARQRPYMPPEVREFGAKADALDPAAGFVLRDCFTHADMIHLQSFRTFLSPKRAVSCDWIDACESLDPKWIPYLHLRYVIARARPPESAAGEPPALESPLGWKVWKISVAPQP